MNKEEVSKRVLKDGKQIDEADFTWCEETSTFSSKLDGLVFSFNDCNNCTFNTGTHCVFNTGHNCTFKTGYNCVFNTGHECTFKTGHECVFNTGYYCTFSASYDCNFKTGSNCTFNTGTHCVFNTGHNCTFKTGYNCVFSTGHNCTFKTGYNCVFNTGYYCTFSASYDCNFKTGSNCTFNTGYNCVFKTGSNCTFNTGYECVIIRRGEPLIFQSIVQPKEGETIELCPFGIKGYLSNGYLNGDKSLGKHIIADGMLSKIISQKSGIYKVINHNKTEETYLIEKNGIYSHGSTLKEAKDSLVYKLANRDTSMYDSFTPETKITKDEAIVMYMTITGACEYGTREFVESQDIPDTLTVQEVINITAGRYGNETLAKFMRSK